MKRCEKHSYVSTIGRFPGSGGILIWNFGYMARRRAWKFILDSSMGGQFPTLASRPFQAGATLTGSPSILICKGKATGALRSRSPLKRFWRAVREKLV